VGRLLKAWRPPDVPPGDESNGCRFFETKAMHSITWATLHLALVLIAICLFVPVTARADDAPAPDSPLVKLLKSGRLPEARQGSVVDMIGKRGTLNDLTFLLQQVTTSNGGFSPTLKVKALEALAEAT
jgi:hypothetical protein